jgi:hypothetical protein
MTPFAIAGIQMHVLPERNIDGIRQRLKLLMHYYPWVEMVLLSELAPFGSSLHYAQRLPGPAEEEFQQMAREHGIWFVPVRCTRIAMARSTTPRRSSTRRAR